MASNYAKQIRETSPGSAFHGKSVIGIYVGRESCPQCGPLLHSLMALLQCRSKATIVFVSKGALEEDTMRYFNTMPWWTAMPHATAAGPCGKALLAKFGVTTIPALVLLDDNGRVICTDARVRLAADSTGLGFLWRAPAGTRCLNPTVDFAMGPAEAPSAVGDQAPSQPESLWHKSAGALPPGALRPHRPTRPPNGGRPPSVPGDKHEVAWHNRVAIDQDLDQHGLEHDRATRALAVPADIADNIHQAPAGIHAQAQTCRDAKRKSPQDIVDAGRPPKEPNRVATQVVPTIYPDAMQVVCNRERAQKNSIFFTQYPCPT
jgi:hypothetical protein